MPETRMEKLRMKAKREISSLPFPKHVEALNQIAKLQGKTMGELLGEALDQYLFEHGAVDEGESG